MSTACFMSCEEAVAMHKDERYNEAAAAAEEFYENAQMGAYGTPLGLRMTVDNIVRELAPLLVIEPEQL